MSTPTPLKSIIGLTAFIVFVDMMGIGLVMPVMPQLIGGLTHTGIDRAAEIGGQLLFAYAVMQFLFAPVIGGLSDRFGRRPILLVTLTLLGCDYALMAWAPSLGWLVLGRLISGMMGATWAAANSCIADVVPPEKRGAAFGALGGAGAAGFVFGPALGGLAGQYHERLPFVLASAMALGGALVGWFILRETLPQAKRRAFSLSRANPLGTLIQMMRMPLVPGCLAAIFFMQLSAQSTVSVWSFYGALKFGWSPLLIGLSVSFYGIMLAAMQGVMAGKAVTAFGAVRVARWGLIAGLPSYLIIAFANATWQMIVAIAIGTLTGITFPALQSLMSARVSEDAQGELQGAIASVISMTSVIGPLIMTALFGHFADSSGLWFPGAPFAAASCLLMIAILILRRTLRDQASAASH